MVTRSDYAGGLGGREHAQSTDIGLPGKSFTDDSHQSVDADLLAHEFIHSWNGKYRRPSGLDTPDFSTPMRGDLLWVYEGMTEYLGNVLAARAGLETQQDYRDMLSLNAADLAYQPGREWRSIADTSIATSLLHGTGYWLNWRRGKAYYPEGELLWLDVDTRIRELTANRKSLDDFIRIFLGKGDNSGPMVLPYDLDQLIQDLSQVAAYDWRTFFNDRVTAVNRRVDMDGIERGGYRLSFTSLPNKSQMERSDPDHPLYIGQDFWYSLGLRVGEDGTLIDVLWNGPGDKEGLSPRQKIVAVNGSKYTAEVLRAAVRHAKGNRTPIQLTIKQEADVFAVTIDYHSGERYPVLVLTGNKPATLDAIITSREHPAQTGRIRRPAPLRQIR